MGDLLDFMEENLYTYKAVCRHVVDGDTMDLDIDLGLHQHSHERVRLFGIDTPETYGVKKDSEEYKAGMKAKERVMELLRPLDHFPEPKQLWVRTYKDKQGKYGRYLAEIWVHVPAPHPDDPELKHEELMCLSSVLVEEGLAEHKEY